MVEKPNSPSILEANIVLMITALLFITLGTKVQQNDIYTGVLITEYLIIMAPTIVYLKITGYSLRETLRLNPISFKQAIMVILIVILSYPVAVFFNYIGIIILDAIAEIKPSPVPIPSEPREFVVGFFAIALSPGICEEVMFRGLMINSYGSFGKKKAIIYSAILFGVFHFNAQNLMGPIYLGMLLGVILYKTNSLYSAIIAHTTNNTIPLAIGYAFNIGNENLNLGMEQINMPAMEEMIYSFFALGAMALIFGILSYKLIKLLPIGNEKDLIEMDNFLPKKQLVDEIYQRERLSINECLPIMVVFAIFFLINYLYFFL